MDVYVVTHSSEGWKSVEGVFRSLEGAQACHDEFDNDKNKLVWTSDYTGSYILPMNPYPIDIEIEQHHLEA